MICNTIPAVENLPAIDLVEAQRIIDLISRVKLTEARLALLQSLAEAGHVQKMQIVGVEKPADVIVVKYDCALK